MNRWAWFTICVLLGLLLLAGGWLMPAHLRAIEPSVLQRAGQNSSSLTGRGMELTHIGQFGAAELVSSAATRAKLPSAGELASSIETDVKRHPEWKAWGVTGPSLRPYYGLRAYFSKAPAGSDESSFTDFVVREQNRTRALATLSASKQPAVQDLLQTRTLTNTVTFAPSQAAGGEAFDTAVVITSLLLEQNRFTPALNDQIHSAAVQANHGNPQPLEQILLDVLSLGQRFNWGQLVTFVGKMDSAATLHAQADLVRNAGDQLPELFSAVELSGNPKGVAEYLKTFPKTGMNDLTTALAYNAGGVRELLRSNHRIYTSPWRQTASEYEPFAGAISLGADYSWRMPGFALILKWILYFCGGLLLALALHFGKPPASSLEAPLQVRGFHVAREILFALGFLLVVLLVSEPFLAQESPAAALPFRLRVPTVGAAVLSGSTNNKTTFMDKSNWLPMLLFFVLQALLYVACIVKLAEIQRQRVGPRVKLKLLKNEEHLFDGGLYLGFLGTIVSFIVYSVYAKQQFSLMVAYSSTSFGILFVSFFKIFHLRPVSRKLLLEAEAELPVATTPVVASSLATP
ncbi:MAG TPA: hypothetical protein VG938_11475 [Verrucomicrobiae bacterium]|jgi:hypothetical protein|nr:hypothetical protein [Verrucomicrobiae bacterium]